MHGTIMSTPKNKKLRQKAKRANRCGIGE